MSKMFDVDYRRLPDSDFADLESRFGFWHTGQFAHDCRLAFGEVPFETLSRAA